MIRVGVRVDQRGREGGLIRQGGLIREGGREIDQRGIKEREGVDQE